MTTRTEQDRAQSYLIYLPFALAGVIWSAGMLFPSHFVWGADFLKSAFGNLGWIGPVGVLLLAIPVVSLSIYRAISRLTSPVMNLFRQLKRPLTVPAVSVLLLALFYVFRSRALVYGDGFIFLEFLSNPNVPVDYSLFALKPLVPFFHRWFYMLASSVIEGSPVDIAALISCTGGVVGFWALYRIADLLRAENISRPLILAGGLASGATVLFFGHVENYTWMTASAMWSLSFSIGYVRGKNRWYPSLLTGLVAVGFHVLALPFLLVSVVSRFYRTGAQKFGGTRVLTKWISALAVIGSVVLAVLVQISRNPDVLVNVWPASDMPYWWLSFAHLLDMTNQTMLVAPLGIGVALIALLKRRPSGLCKPEEDILRLSAVLTFLVAFWVNPLLGASRDWDLLSLYGFPVSIWAVYRLALSTGKSSRYSFLIVPVCATCLVSLVPNLIEKNNLSSAAVRLDSQLWHDAHYQPDYQQAERCSSWGFILKTRLEDMGRSRKYFRRRAEAGLGFHKAWFNLGEIYARIEKNDSAWICFGRAASLSPQNGAYVRAASEMAFKVQRYEDALAYGQQAVTLGTNSAEHQMQLGMTLTKLDRYDAAMEHYRNALQLDPRSQRAHLVLGMSFSDRQVHDSAFYYLSRGLELDQNAPGLPIVYRVLTTSALSSGQCAEARQAFERLSRLVPGSSDVALLRNQLREVCGEK